MPPKTRSLSTAVGASDPEQGMDENIAQVLTNINSRLDIMDSLSIDVKAIQRDIQSIRNEDIKDIRNEIGSLKSSVEFAHKSADDAMKKAVSNENKIKNTNDALAQMDLDLRKTKRENSKLKEHILKTESQERRNNLIFEGYAEPPEGQKEDCFAIVANLLSQTLKVTGDIKIDRCHRLGQKGKKPRPIIFRVHFYPDRERIWKAKKLCKGTGLFLREDYPNEILKRRQILEPIRKKAEESGRYAILSYDRLMLDHQPYTLQTLHLLPKELRPEELATLRGDGVTAFFSASCPLSNFAKCSFRGRDGLTYSSTEQYFQYHKALFNNDEVTAKMIIETDEPSECKYLGRMVSIIDQKLWEEDQATKIMHQGCMSKFQQNMRMQEFLLSTDEDIIIEASPKDTYWGVGLSIKHDDILKPQAWKGANNMGKILSNIRDILKQ